MAEAQQPKVTFVTGYFDVGRREGWRPAEAYLKEVKWLLAKPLPHLMLFVEKAFEETLRPLLDPARHTLVLKELEELPLYSRLGELKKMGESHPWMRNPCRNVVLWSKFDLLREALARNPRGSSHFAWIDFGIHFHHTEHNWPDEKAEAFQVREDKVKLMLINYFPPVDGKYDTIGLAAAGYISGSAENIAKLCVLMAHKFADFASKGLMPLEERGLHDVFWENGDLFKPYFGQYMAVMANYNSARLSVEYVVEQHLMPAYNAQDWRHATVVGDWLWDHYLHGRLTIAEAVLAKVLDHYFIALYYSGALDRARAVKAEYLKLACINEFRALQQKGDAERLAANFAFV